VHPGAFTISIKVSRKQRMISIRGADDLNPVQLAGIMAKSAHDTNKRLDSLTNRLAKLNARTALDTGCTFMLLFRLLNKETREQVVKWAATSAYERLEQKLRYPETNIQELMHWLEEEPGNAPNGRKA
jgi:hypothetical protein